MNKTASPTLNESIKMIGFNLINSMRLTDIFFGTVISVSPLKIQIDQKHILEEPSLILTNMVREHAVDVTVSMQTENDAFMIPDHTHKGNLGNPTDTGTLDTTHKHEIKHKIKMLQHYGLKVNEKVVLLRMQGGQRYLVIDRVEVPICEGEWL